MSVNAVVISASSDIGAALCEEWRGKGWNVFGTYRTPAPLVTKLKEQCQLFPCDLMDKESLQAAAKKIGESCLWDVLVFGPGHLEPIGDFQNVDFDAWEKGIQINLLRQLRLLHLLLPFRNRHSLLPEPTVLFFAGGGVNNAVPYYSSYTLSKIALTKMCEFLDAEIPDTRFVILGPGCVKTKIHEPTLRLKTGAHYQKTLLRLQNNDCTPMQQVIDSCTYLVTTPCRAVRGRNFSTAFDKWGSADLEAALENDGDMYKLRRHANTWHL